MQPDDSLDKISLRYNSNKHAIEKLNNLPNSTISPGMKLKIPYEPIDGPGFIAYNSNFERPIRYLDI